MHCEQDNFTTQLIDQCFEKRLDQGLFASNTSSLTQNINQIFFP